MSKEIFEALVGGSKVSVAEFDDQLDAADIKKFFAYNFGVASPSYLDRLMFATKPRWENFSIRDWIDVIELTSNHELAIIYCLTFLYKYIGIDSLKLFGGLTSMDKVKSIETLKYFENYEGVLAIIDRMHLPLLKEFGLQLSSFDQIRNRLTKEGASEAVRIYPKIIYLRDYPDFTQSNP